MPKMAAELQLLGLAIVIGIVQLSWAAIMARLQQGMAWSRGPRDEPNPASGVAARLERAFANYMETFPFFAAAVIAAYLAGKLGPLTMWGSAAYVAARAVYVPVYAAGFRWRFVVWSVAMFGLLAVVVALFL